ncbi:MAG: hypothetical protein CHACPFDD_00409 [Phycisphaerae bacterium]|nr:hypothetical protein [Phycisphaerae bacterium]
MALNIAKEIADLKQMTVRELREKYEGVFGEPTRAGNRDWLFKRIAWRIQALAEGDLSERARQRAEFLARDADLRTTAPRTVLAAAGGNGNGSAAKWNGERGAKPVSALTDERVPPPGTLSCMAERSRKNLNFLPRRCTGTIGAVLPGAASHRVAACSFQPIL